MALFGEANGRHAFVPLVDGRREPEEGEVVVEEARGLVARMQPHLRDGGSLQKHPRVFNHRGSRFEEILLSMMQLLQIMDIAAVTYQSAVWLNVRKVVIPEQR